MQLTEEEENISYTITLHITPQSFSGTTISHRRRVFFFRTSEALNHSKQSSPPLHSSVFLLFSFFFVQCMFVSRDKKEK